MTTNYAHKYEDDYPVDPLDIMSLRHALEVGKGKAMPVLSPDGSVAFLFVDKDEGQLDRKLGVVLRGAYCHNSPMANIGAIGCDPYYAVHTGLEEHQVSRVPNLKSFVLSRYSDKDEARNQILEAVYRKGITAVAPTTSVGLPSAPSQVSCAPKAGPDFLIDRIRFLEGQLRSNLPYMQMYKFGAGSLVVAIVSLIVWALTGAGVPFHPVFAALVIPASIGLMVMAFLVRRDIPNPPKTGNK